MGIQVLEEEIPGISHPRIKVSSLLKGLFFARKFDTCRVTKNEADL